MNARRSATERSRENKSYNLYCINFYGSGLKSIKDEFKRQLQTGLRRSVFILDLDDLKQELNNQPRTTRQHKDYLEYSSDHLLTAILQVIHSFRHEYDSITKKINDELKFDLYQYWLKDIEDKQNISMINTASLKDNISLNTPLKRKSNLKSQIKKSTKSKRASKKSLGNITPFEEGTEEAMDEVNCVANTVVKEHNRVGQGEMLSKRKYIKDNPADDKLFIIIIGHQTEEFYLDLLSRGQPVQGIVNFLPEESNYDILLNNTKQHIFIKETLEFIHNSIYTLRQVDSMKPVGLFTYNLPVISKCLATKYQRDIYDQLTGGIYDIETLQQQYQSYYYKPFQETNVALPLDVDLVQLYHVAESLSAQGHFQQNFLSGSASDMATIVAYMDSLLNTCGLPDSKLDILTSTFESLTKIRKFERLFVEESNQLLNNMLLYADPSKAKSIYLSYLDYNLWSQYVTNPYQTESDPASPINPLSLPGFIKLYITEDSCAQRISEHLSLHDDYDVAVIGTGCKLYTYRRTYNAVFEDERLIVIPTRLCFRDFTLFQKEEFFDNLITPEMREAAKEETKRKSLAQGGIENKMKMVDLDENIFIRPNSLKSLKLSERSSEHSKSKWEKEVRSSRKHSRQYDKRPSINRKSLQSQEWVGLPPDHHLLKGYNLEDTRQEIRLKTSKYFFEQGCLQLYEEKWCFQDMNKALTLMIDNCSIFLNRRHQHHQVEGISNNIRLETKNKVNIGILNESQECSRIVMNYPNGLGIYQHDMYCEQIWLNAMQTPNGEKRRIITPYGAVIVFFKKEDMIIVMRYNGEVYRLLQYEYSEEEVEEEQKILSAFSDDRTSEINDPKAQGDYVKSKAQEKPSMSLRDHGQGDNTGKRTKTKFLQQAQNSKSDESVEVGGSSSHIPINRENLKASINDELGFLLHISSIYELSYENVKLTTSQGRRFTITKYGEISEDIPCQVQEWHDYYANESYSHQCDGVKMIWTQDSLKCYHQDGTVLTTRTEEQFEQINKDELEFQISQSSSHEHVQEMEQEGCSTKQKPRQNSIGEYSTIYDGTKIPSYAAYLSPEGLEEFAEESDYLCYICSSCLIQHHDYAGVYMLWLRTSTPTHPMIFMEIFGIDNIFIYTTTEHCHGEQMSGCDEGSREQIISPEGSNAMGEDHKVLIHIWVGHSLHLTVERNSDGGNDYEIKCDSFTLRFVYNDCLTDVFKYLVNEIATFHNYNGKQTKESYFVERIGKDGKSKGFEFLNSLPNMPYYSHTSSNCILEAKPLKTINELMKHNSDCYKKDMRKFPRFRANPTKKSLNVEENFPLICTTSIYCKVPLLLQNTKDIVKFLEPFENMNFKNLRPKMMQLLDVYLRPQLELDVKHKYSRTIWHKRQQEHGRRKFREQQRKGLYHAMLKHHIFPNYFKFTKQYEGHVRHIDFFDYVKFECENKEVKKEEVYWSLQNNGRNTKSGKRTPHCKYGSYDK